MKKIKLFSLFAAVFFVGSAMAATTSYIPTAVHEVTGDEILYTASGNETITAGKTAGWIVIPAESYSSKTPLDLDGTQQSSSTSCLQVKAGVTDFSSKSRVIHLVVKGITGVVASGYAKESCGFQIGATEYTASMSETTTMNVVAGNTAAVNPVSYNELDANKTYIISVFGYGTSDGYLYAVKLIAGSAAKDDATLKSITVNNVEIEGFDAATTAYDIVLPFGTTKVPFVAATATSANATVSITQAEAVDGSASILVIAEDNTTRKTYTVNFSVAEPSDDATLSAITVGGEALEGFTPAQLTYGIELAYGTTLIPTVTATTTDEKATYTVTYVDDKGEGTTDLPCIATIEVTAEDGSTKQTYTIAFTVSTTASTDATLASITLDGVSIADFASATTAYTVKLAYIADVPEIEATPTHAAATVVVDAPVLAKGETGDATITVTAQDGKTIKVYTISFTRAAAEAAKLYEVIFSNNAKGAIDVAKQTVTVPYLADTEEALMPTTEEKNITVQGAGATVALNESNQIVMTSADNKETIFTIVGAPLVPKELGNETVTFDGTEKYFFAPAGFITTGWRAHKNIEDETNPRITSGKCRMYIALPACTSVTLTTGGKDNRKAQLYVNGVNQGEVTFEGYSSYKIEKDLSNTSANFIGIENHGSGDLVFANVLLTGAKEVETSFEQAQVEAKAVKVIRDGQLLIIREGKIYTAQGVELR